MTTTTDDDVLDDVLRHLLLDDRELVLDLDGRVAALGVEHHKVGALDIDVLEREALGAHLPN